jgi:hypothetical protein
MQHVSVVDTNLTTDKFTWHRLHTNSSGKEMIAKIIGQTITTLSTSGNPPISVKWEEVPLATPTTEAKMGYIGTNDDGVHKNVASSLCRPKIPPVTRNEDFLWIACTSKTV